MSRTLLIVGLLFAGCSSASNAESKDTETSAADAVKQAREAIARPMKTFNREDKAFVVGRHYGMYEGYLAISRDKSLDRDGTQSSKAMKSLAMVQSQSMFLGIRTPDGPGQMNDVFVGIEKKNSTKLAQTFGLGYEVSRQWLQGKDFHKFPDAALLEGIVKKLALPEAIVAKAAAAGRAPSTEALAELGELLDRHY
jgi:hypothetical protein